MLICPTDPEHLYCLDADRLLAWGFLELHCLGTVLWSVIDHRKNVPRKASKKTAEDHTMAVHDPDSHYRLGVLLPRSTC